MTFRRVATFALLASIAFCGAALAAPYADGLSLTAGNVKLSFLSCSAVVVGSAVPKDCSSLQVSAVTKGSGSPADPFLNGFSMSGFIGGLSLGSDTIMLKYTATIIEPRFVFSDMHLSQTGSAIAGASISDAYSSGGTPEGALTSDGLMPVTSTTPLGIVSVFDVTSVIAVASGDITALEQLYSEDQGGHTQGLPEPASIALLGAALVLGGALLRSRLRVRAATPHPRKSG